MSDEQILKDLAGEGTILKLLTGSEKGKVKYKEYHMTPVSLKDIPELFDLLRKFEEESNKGVWNKECIDVVVKIIMMSLKKAHPEIEESEIREVFGLGGMAKAIKAAMDMNDFLLIMRELKGTLSEAGMPS